MNRRLTIVNSVLGVALVASLALNVLERTAAVRPNFEYFPDMARTARFNAFSPNPNFPDGMTLQVPVAGTIPRGLPPIPRGTSGPPLDSPFAADDAAAAERGAVVFASFCQPCHGPDGK